jgi:hypothetical protein
MDWATHQPEFRFDIRAERAECERLLLHQARVLQDLLVRRSRTDRTRRHSIPEWEKVCQAEARERKLLHQAKGPRLGQREKLLIRAQRKDAAAGATLTLNRDGS